MIQVDGTYGEGGGQIVRTSLSLAAITGKSIEIEGVRGRRSKPGLQPQHLMAVKAAGQICSAAIQGAEVGSSSFRFEPGSPVLAGTYRFDIGTAGATTLVAQTVLLPLALAEGPSVVTITGGTHNPMAPCVDYLELVYLPVLRRMGVEVSLDVPRFGFFPRGGGELTIRLGGSSKLKPIDLTRRGEERSRFARVITSGLPEDVAVRGARQLERAIQTVDHFEKPSLGPGAAAFIGAEFEGGFGAFTGLGERGKRMEKVAQEAVEPFRSWLAGDAPTDEHLADQLVLPAMLAHGTSRWRASAITEHLRSVIWLARQFVSREVEVDEASGTVTVS